MTSYSDSKLTLPVGERDHRQGSPTAPVILVEYGDFECSYCGEAYPIVKQVQKALGDDLQFIFRNFPLATVHPHAQKAAEAAESAGAQGRYWEMHDALYAHQQDLTAAGIERIASLAGADSAKVKSEMEAGTYEDRVYEDFMSGVRSGVNGTPTFFINGLRFDGSWDAVSLIAVLKSVEANSER